MIAAPEISLDSMLTPDQCAEWLQIPLRELQDKTREQIIPAVRLSHKVIRYHPRTILDKFGAITPQQIIQQIKS